MPQSHSYSIVGSFYRPPAKAILAVLPIATRLYLRAEPDNAFDPNAIMVLIRMADFPERAETAFDNEGAGYGYDMERLRGEEEEWHLGYIPKGLAAVLRADDSIKVDVDYPGEFECSSTGAPFIRLEL